MAAGALEDAAAAENTDIYEAETNALGFRLAEYYDFCKVKYQQSILLRILAWELVAVWASICAYYIPFWSWGLGVADSSGRTEDLFAASLAVYSCNIVMHHFQMYVTIRNYTKWFAFTCTLSIIQFYPIFLMAANHVGDRLWHRIGELIVHQWVLFYGSVVIATFVAIAPIYAFKIIKMTCSHP